MKSVTNEEINRRLVTENPWWEDNAVIPYRELNHRPYFHLFYPLVKQTDVRRAVVLMGPRRVGKTVMIHQTIQQLLDEGWPAHHLCYVSVNDPIYNGMGLDNMLDAFSRATNVDYTNRQCFIFFDEIQYLKDWEKYLMLIVDRYPSVKPVVSGSAAAALRLKSDESGAGRLTDFFLPPLTFHEYLELLGKQEFIEMDFSESPTAYRVHDIEGLNQEFIHYLNFGGYPEVIFSPEIQRNPGRFIKDDIIDKVLLRDLPSLYGIEDIQELNSLFATLAFNTADEISLDQLSTTSGVSKNTIKRYMAYLEAAFLIQVVNRVDKNARRFKRQSFFKVYLTNPSMRSALFSPLEPDDDAMGDMVETGIFSQWFHHETIQLHYARWKSGEVDLVSLTPEQRVQLAVEVKWSDSYIHNPKKKLKALVNFCDSHSIGKCIVTSKTDTGIRTVNDVDIQFTPASVYSYIIGHAIIENKSIFSESKQRKITMG